MALTYLGAKTQVRSGAIGATFDAAPTVVPINTQNQSILVFDCTPPAGGAVLKIEFCYDLPPAKAGGGPTQADWQALTFYRKCLLDVANAVAGTNTQDSRVSLKTLEIFIPATDKYQMEVPILATGVRISAKGALGAGGTLTAFVVSGVS